MKAFIFSFLLIILLFAYKLGLADYLTFHYLQAHLTAIQSYVAENAVISSIGYFAVYVIATTLSFPGAAILTLFAGAVFGILWGVIIVSLASTVGATFAFWASRFLFKDFLSKKFPNQLQIINKNVDKDGAFYLLTLRLIPIFPFFLVNLLMGITTIKSRTYSLVSLLGMFPATVVFVYAGQKFSEITSLKGILGPEIISAFVLLGVFPYIASFLLKKVQHYRLYKTYKKPKSFDYNMIVIGGGSAGLVTSYISAVVNAKVALVEKEKMGGDCLNYGCVPSKALIKTAKTIHQSKKAKELGLEKIEIEFKFSDVMSRVKRIISTIEPHDSMERYKELGVDCFSAEAKILSPYSVSINGVVYTTKNITIATGAKPLVPKIPGIQNSDFLTSDTLWDLKELPPRLLIIGGGPIGSEMAQCFSRLGSKVTIIESGANLLSKEDSEARILIEKIFKSEGIAVMTNHKALKFFINESNERCLVCEGPSGEVQFVYDKVLIAVGRSPNTTGFGLEELGVAIKKNGTIETNDYMESTFPNIFACGDVTGPYQLTHMAAHQAWYCSVNGLFGAFKKFKVDYSVVPWCTFTDPEVATVGINEDEARQKKLDYEMTIYHMNDLDRAIADDDTQGFVKVITQKGSDKILGATIVSSQASLMILEFISAMKFKKGLKDILATIHLYPSLGEANKYTAGLWSKNHAPERILSYLKKYFAWIRS